MSEHLLNTSEVGAALEQMGREGVAKEVGVDALGLEAGFCRQTPQDQECAGTRQRAALCVEEELRAVAPVGVRSPPRELAAQRVDRLTPDRDNAFLAALADGSDESLVEVDARAVERDGLAHP